MYLLASRTCAKTAIGYFHLKITMMQLFGDFKHLFITFIKFVIPMRMFNVYKSDFQ